MRIESLRVTNDQEGLNKLLAAWLPDEKFDILVKCWTFPKHKEFWGCCGEHTELIRSTMRCPAWDVVMLDLRSQLEALWKHKDRILVACADGQGTHRSVSVAAALKQLCLKKGLLGRGPHHLCRENWQKKKFVPRASTVSLTKKRKICTINCNMNLHGEIFLHGEASSPSLLLFSMARL